jgi:hypothetical protein
MNEARHLGLSWNDQLAYLIAEGQSVVQDKTECPVKHSFAPGVYVREMFIPANTWFIGRPHLKGHRCTLEAGRVKLITAKGTMELRAGDEMTTEPGYMMALYAITDVLGRTYHPNPTESHDTAALEAEIFESLPSIIARVEQMKLAKAVA